MSTLTPPNPPSPPDPRGTRERGSGFVISSGGEGGEVVKPEEGRRFPLHILLVSTSVAGGVESGARVEGKFREEGRKYGSEWTAPASRRLSGVATRLDATWARYAAPRPALGEAPTPAPRARARARGLRQRRARARR